MMELTSAKICFVSTLIVSTLLHTGQGSVDEVRLVKNLFDDNGYNPLIRPVQNLTEIIKVNFGLALIQLIYVDEKNQIMKSNNWLRLIWHDYQLTWNPEDYGDIKQIRVPPDKCWTPDIVLFNKYVNQNADGKYEVSYKSNLVVSNDGTVLYVPPSIYKSSCQIDVEYFPFDEQSCDMIFGSWTFSGDQVTLDWYYGKQGVDFNDYIASGTWTVMAGPAKIEKREANLEENEPPKTTMIYTVRIRRKTLFYTVNLIIPCVLISFLTVCVFYLPSEACEKITLCISILIALVVFILLVSKILPPTSLSIPLIAKYLLFTFIMNIVSILATVITINWHFRSPRSHKMPRWVRVLFLNYLPRLLFMKRPDHMQQYYRGLQNDQQTKSNMSSEQNGNETNLYNVNSRTADFEMSELHPLNVKVASKSPSLDRARRDMEPSPDHVMPLTPDAYKAAEAVRFIAQHLRKEDDYDAVLEDWKFIAMVIDRLLLLIFMGVTIAGTISILINAPHIFEFVDQATILKELST